MAKWRVTLWLTIAMYSTKKFEISLYPSAFVGQ